MYKYDNEFFVWENTVQSKWFDYAMNQLYLFGYSFQLFGLVSN